MQGRMLQFFVPRPCVVGVDLGGTNVRAGAFYEDSSEAGKQFSNPSHAQEGVAKTIAAIAATAKQAMEASASPVQGIGMAVPGHIDNARGMVRWAPNFGETIDGVFRYWQDVQLRKPLEKALGVPVYMDNDANMAALGEYKFGSGKNSAKCLVMLTLGTGVGGGVIMSPESVIGDARGLLVLVGANKGGAELGHTVINYQGLDANVGAYGELEAYCQRDGIVKRAVHRATRRPESILNKLVEGDLGKLTPKMITDAANQGDEVAIEVWEETGTMLGLGIGNFINVFAPDVFAIGGQIVKAGDWLMKPAIKSARNVAIPSLFKDANILPAEQVEDAGMLGGAALALEALKWNTKPR